MSDELNLDDGWGEDEINFDDLDIISSEPAQPVRQEEQKPKKLNDDPLDFLNDFTTPSPKQDIHLGKKEE